MPAVYGLTLRDDYVHEAEHGLYLFTAVLMWASFLGVDPLPHRAGPRAELACMVGCMLPMAVIALWLLSAHEAVYGHYLAMLGPSALRDQRLAGAIMLAAGFRRLPSRRWRECASLPVKAGRRSWRAAA